MTIVTRCCVVLLATIAALVVVPTANALAACANPVACDNAQSGTPSDDWYVQTDSPRIAGYPTSMSVNKGQTISFKIKAETNSYSIDIYRLGYYAGDGARLVQGNVSHNNTATTQAQCLTFDDTGLIDCGNWAVTASWQVPATAVSGVYVADLSTTSGEYSKIIFVVRDDSSHSDIVVQTSDATWQAYNAYGGNSLYTCSVECPEGNPHGYKAALKVSYNRPLITEDQSALFTGAEYPLIRFLEQNGYDVSYVSSADVANHPELIRNHKLFISSGHDEYWSASQRSSMEAARDAGVNLAFFTGNEGFWKTRWEPSRDGANTPDRTLVAYKDTHFDDPADQDPVSWTGTWRDPRFTTAADGVTPENALTGQIFLVNSGTSNITVPYAFRNLRMWRNTAVASLTQSNQSVTLGKDTLGYEWDQDADNGYRPAGSFQLSSTTVPNVEVFTDYGSTTKFGQTATHNMTMYKAPSGARVFGAGTVQWAWGLSDWNPNDTAPDRNMQQATINLLADLDAQPSTRAAGLVAASKTTDTTSPSTTVSAPSTAADGSVVTLSGTATDTGGGVVAGVEISTDGGSTWHPATTGTTNWTYKWIVHGSPTATIKVRVTDDSGNTSAPTAGTNVNVTCPCSIWGTNVTPPSTSVDSGDPESIEVGVRFKSDVLGTVSGIRFYKAAANTGTHVGSLWDADGQLLANATFTNESASGWQSVTFSSPVTIQPNTTYVASYLAPKGHYSGTPDWFWRANTPGPTGGGTTDGSPLHALRSTGSAQVNGVFTYTSGPSFPAQSYASANYWVDISFTPTPPPGQVTGVVATSGGKTSANVAWTAPASGGPASSYKITPYIGATAQTPVTMPASAGTAATVTGLTNGTTYTFRVQAANLNGAGAVSSASNPVTPSVPVVPSAPSGVVARPATKSALVTWTAASSDGDSAITGQTVTPYVGATAQGSVQVGASATSATVTGLTNGTSYTFKVSATNGVGVSPQSGASGAVTPQSTLFDFDTPSTVDAGDPWSAEYGVKFKADYSGSVTGVRFYKSAANTGTHVGSLWRADGTKLASATFTNETASGWQSVTFASPVAVTAGTTYIASYFTPSGHPSVTGGAFAMPVTNGPLNALADSVSANGLYLYSESSTLPTQSFNATNYGVDVLFSMPLPGQVTGVSATAGQQAATVSWSVPGGGVVTSYKVTPYIGSVAQTTKVVSAPAMSTTVSGLTSGTAYTFRVQAVNPAGSGPLSAGSNSVTPTAPAPPGKPVDVSAQADSAAVNVAWISPDSDGGSPITGYVVTPYVGASAQSTVDVAASATSARITGLTNGTDYTFTVKAKNAIGTGAASAASAATTPRHSLFGTATPGGALDAGDPDSIVVGVKFTADVPGAITGIRFYKAPANDGAHVGALWTADGEQLASGAFTSESPSGWQTLTFAEPVPITADTTYVASYLAPHGHYSAVGGAFTTDPIDSPPLHAPSTATSANGVYTYSAASVFPASTYNATNYSVDVLFAPAPS